jgi:hypothetical protein
MVISVTRPGEEPGAVLACGRSATKGRTAEQILADLATDSHREFRRYSYSDVFENPTFMLAELRSLLG